ncbi:MAG: DPP IV N-terminal domain-containing protein [Bacteroidales bacterium]|nr:DPP IV N-terminal domain-containing protein [Bacteroidales bacterium]
MMKGIWLICALLFAAQGQAQEKPLSVEGIYGGGLLQVKGVRMMQWMKDGRSYTVAEYNGEQQADEIVRYDAATGSRTVLVPAQWLKDENGASLPLQAYRWSADERRLLLFHHAVKVWRYPTRGCYLVLDMATGKHYALGRSAPKASLMFAEFSPDGSKVAWVSGNNIHVEDLATQEITRLTHDGNSQTINGVFDWMYEEEFDCRQGFRWSHDGKNIAYWQTDTRGTGVFHMVNNVDSIYPRLIPLSYPKVGTVLPAVRTGVVPVAGGSTVWMDIPGDPRENYLPRMEYVPESDDLIIRQFNRAQNINRVWMVHDGKARLLFTETDDAWVDAGDDLRWIGGNRAFIWMSERDGWRHPYLISRDGKEARCLTPGNFDVVSVAGMDEENGYLYFIAAGKDFTRRSLYRASLDGKGEVRRMDVEGQEGQHACNFAPGGKWALHTFQNAVTPPVYAMVRFPEHVPARILEDNAAARREFERLNLARKEFIRVDIGDIVLDAWMTKPPAFDPAGKYPVIVHVYGEPAGSTVQDNWAGGDLWHRYLAQEGYIVVSIDNRGANVPRGRAWRKSVYRKIGIINVDDQAAAMRKMTEQYPFMDAARIGISGWSGGGSTTLGCMFRYPEIYRTGIAIAFISHQKLYDAAYQERYMGLPEGEGDAFEQGSAVTHAAGLQGNLLLIHGTGDDNVHYQHCELLINELIRHGKMFSLLAYPMRSHGIYEGENTTLHLRLSMDRYWKTNLPVETGESE